MEGQERVRSNKFGQRTNETIDLSVQNLVDCVIPGMGCVGGSMLTAFNYIKRNNGIDSEMSYPYEAQVGECRFQEDEVVFNDVGGAVLPKGDEEKLKEMVAKFGPVAVGIDASSYTFQSYKKGIYYDKDCKNSYYQINHYVLVVGYGIDEKDGDYWIVVSDLID